MHVIATVEEFKVTKARAEITLKESRDTMVSQASITMSTGRKWGIAEAVSHTENPRTNF